MEAQVEQLCFEAGTLPDNGRRRAFIHSHPGLMTSQIVSELTECIRSAVRIDLPKASALAETAVTIATELNDDESLGLALRAKANATWFLGDCRSAVSLFDRAVEILERAGNRSEVARTLSSSIQSRSLLGEYDSAFQSAEKAREIFRELGEGWRIARLEINVANILHRQNRYAEALSAYERAYNELLPHKDMEGIGVALHNIAVCLIALDDYSAAKTVYARMRQVCDQNGMPLLVAQADYNIAYLYFLRGEYSRSLELLRQTRDAFQKNGDHYHLGLCDLDASGIYLELDFVQEAADAAASSLEQFRQLGMNYEMVRSQLNLAVAVSLQGRTDRALELYKGAREMASQEQNKVLAGLIDLHSAMTLFERCMFNDARQLCENAQHVFEDAALPSKRVACLLLLGRILLASGNFAQAAPSCDLALQMLQELDAPALLYQAEFLRGQILEASGKRAEAYSHYQAARSSLETLRSSLQGDELKVGFMRNRVAVYSRLVQLCLERDGGNASEEVFSYVEGAKSRTLQDLILAGPQPVSQSHDKDDSSRRVRDLRQSLNWYYHLIEREQYSADGMSQERLQHLRAQSVSCERELQRMLLDSLAGGISAGLENARTADISEICKVLGTDATLLEYFAIDEQIYVMVLSSKLFNITPVAKVAEIVQHLRMLEFQLSKFHLEPAYVTRFEAVLIKSCQAHLQALFRKLIAGIEHMLTTTRLVVVPHGQLHSLPFQALFDGKEYLIDRFSICHAPSASVFAYTHRSRIQNERPTSLVIGVDDPLMPSVKQEIEAVAKVLPRPKVLWGAEATEEHLLEYGATSSFIHIATHGSFRPDSPMFSAIRLADSYLTLYDLYRMNLPAEFLTLSGCVTGLNVVDKGDELMGLTRGLLYSGAQSLLLSLWDVDDKSTSEFMTAFYEGFSPAFPKADALRSAMLRIRERRPHPYHWAAFKLTGKAFA